MKYSYNYSFLSDWYATNSDRIQKKQMLEALEAKDYTCLNGWIAGDKPMPIYHILRFCNTFQIDICSFFRDADNGQVCTFKPERPNINDQLEPNGGYRKGKRNVGDHGVNPMPCMILPSQSPYEPMVTEEGTETLTGTLTRKETEGEPSGTVAGADALIALEQNHLEQRNKLLDIIAEQQKQIADLTKKLLQKEKTTFRYGMVGEETVEN